MLQYAVFGDPVAHSLSPQIHEAFARQFRIRLTYRKVRVKSGGLAAAIRKFSAAGGKGLNITLPLKQEAADLCDSLSPAARLAGAANTLLLKADRVHGDNTDGAGLVTDIIENLGRPLSNQRVLILGAGGAVRGIMQPVIDQRPASITLANRTLSKAQALAEAFASAVSLEIDVRNFAALSGDTFDCIINGTSAGLAGETPALPSDVYRGCRLAYDMMYGADTTPFLRRAAESGALRTADGLGMLVEQAAESFFLWHRVKPDTGAVIAMLREELEHGDT